MLWGWGAWCPHVSGPRRWPGTLPVQSASRAGRGHGTEQPPHRLVVLRLKNTHKLGETSFTHEFIKMFLSPYCVPGTVLDAEDTAMTKETGSKWESGLGAEGWQWSRSGVRGGQAVQGSAE